MGGVDDVAPVGGDVAVERLGALFVEIHHHRVLAGRIEIFGLVEQALEGFPVGADPPHQLHRPPVVFLLLGIGLGNPGQGGERIPDPDVGELHEGTPGHHPLVRGFGLDRHSVGRIGHDDLLGSGAGSQLVPVESGGPGILVDRPEQERLGRVQGFLVPRPEAASPAPAGAINRYDPEDQALPASQGIGHHDWCAAPGGIDFPDIPPVVDQHGAVAPGPAAQTPRRGGRRGVPGLLVEADRD